MELLTDAQALTRWSRARRASGGGIGFVPTMGALHAGHIALIHAARQQCAHVVASIFVNPTQFGPNEDFSRYPRTLEADQAMLTAAGCDALYLPEVREIYPEGFQTRIQLPEISAGLCGAVRPGHFDGVALVVTILLNRVQPDVAFFGLKDYQQFLLIERLVTDLAMPLRVVGVPTVRESDGLAMSSRNRYLNPEERQRAGALYRALLAARDLRRAGEGSPELLEGVAREVLHAAGIERVEYVAVRAARTLLKVATVTDDEDPVMLLAVRLGSARLIDNMVLSREDGA
ncbi:Pantothenate synthetase [Candidatus Magnetaquicoccaceae bacterium FCR-1]|uniref:Pantothenate synthetase n=1 Tax=Candidatus Magnetaquiglobus chichijimensis TaxID=3141448 RepID=A0ABQ0CDL6_9PROT